MSPLLATERTGNISPEAKRVGTLLWPNNTARMRLEDDFYQAETAGRVITLNVLAPNLMSRLDSGNMFYFIGI
jgi:hypothetical protein